MAKNLQKSYPRHKKSLLDESVPGTTSLSNYFWKDTNQGRDPKVPGKFLERNVLEEDEGFVGLVDALADNSRNTLKIVVSNI